MKKKFMIFAGTISAYNYLMLGLFYYMDKFLAGMVFGIIGTFLLTLVLYKWIIKPVEIIQKQLIQANEENLRAEKIRSEFVANVSHELKTPLTSILGFVETLQDGAAENPEIRRKFLDIIAIETSRLRRLIEDLLVLSDIENKRHTDNISQINIKKSIQEIISSLEPIVHSKDVRIQIIMDDSLHLEGNEDRFKQMMLNLIENSIKYSKEKGSVYITAEKKEEAFIEVVVRDEGIGIAEEHIKRLFERFYRVDKSRSTKAGGTGLGLSIVKHIANLFDAELSVDSKINRGSSFKVIFPIK